MTNLKNVLNDKCRSLSNCGKSKTVVDIFCWGREDYLQGGVFTGETTQRGVLPNFWVGVCRTVLKILTLFQTKIYYFSDPFSDPTTKI